jgi:hypothetical protein
VPVLGGVHESGVLEVVLAGAARQWTMSHTGSRPIPSLPWTTGPNRPAAHHRQVTLDFLLTTVSGAHAEPGNWPVTNGHVSHGL